MTNRLHFLSQIYALIGTLCATSAFANDGKNIIKTHAINEFDAPKYASDFQHFDYVNPDAPTEGEISIAVIGTFDSMNPYATLSGKPGALSNIGYEAIMGASSDEVGTQYCLLCETIEYPEDQSWVIFNLREDATFSDGTPMSADDVAFSYDMWLEQGTPSYRAGLKALVAGYEVLGPQQMKFTYRDTALKSGRIGQLAGLTILSKAWFEKTGARLDEARLDPGIGTGEYRLKDLDVGRSITYERNPDYWGKDHPTQVGRGNFDLIELEYFTNTSAAFEAFKAGDVTFRQENSSIQWSTGYDFPAIQNGFVTKKFLPKGDLPYAGGFVFNLRNEKFSDPSLRRALGLMYNFTWTNENLQFGLFSQRESFWENPRLKAVGLPQGEELAILESVKEHLPTHIFSTPALLPHKSGSRPLDRSNLRRALALMEKAGYVPDEGGQLRNAKGERLDIEFLETRASFDRIIQPYIENLKRLGVNATYNRVDPAQYQARQQSNAFDMVFASYRVGLLEGRGLSQRFGCEDKDDIFNPAGFCNKAVDILADRVADAKTYDEMAVLVKAIDRIMRDAYFVVPVWYLKEHWVSYYDMFEHPEELPEFDLGYLDFWWYNDSKAEQLRAQGAFR